MRTIAARTLLDGTLTVTLNPTLRPTSTLALLRQPRLYRTSEAPLKLQPYNIRAAHKPITTLRRLLNDVKDKDKLDDKQGADYTRTNAATSRLLTFVKPAENLSKRLTEHNRAARKW